MSNCVILELVVTVTNRVGKETASRDGLDDAQVSKMTPKGWNLRIPSHTMEIKNQLVS